MIASCTRRACCPAVLFGWCVIAAAISFASCAGVSPPTEQQRMNAGRLFPGLPAADLAAGKNLYHRKCGSCHALHAPESRTMQQWAQSLGHMKTKVRLTEDESFKINRYLHAGAVDAGGNTVPAAVDDHTPGNP